MGRVLLVSMVSLSLALTGCASLAGGAPTPTTALGKPCPFANTVPDPNATPTMLQAVRPYNLILNLPAFSRCIADTARVQRLYTAALALPPKAPGVYACPKSWSITYELTFLADGMLVRTMTQEADGCGFLHLSETDVRDTNEAFQQHVADTIGLPSLLPFGSPSGSGTT
jgi:hypothetical protein